MFEILAVGKLCIQDNAPKGRGDKAYKNLVPQLTLLVGNNISN